MILIGSRALALRAPQILMRKPLDFDFVCTQQEFDSWLEQNSAKINAKKIYPLMDGKKMIVEGDSICEFEINVPGTSTEMLLDLVEGSPDSMETSFGDIPSLDMLFTIKSSHKYLKNSPHFWKTAFDYHRMKMLGAKVRPEYEAFLKLREKETYNYAHPKLNVSKDNFFKDDGLQYVWDHDDIHKSVAIYERPAYTYYLKEGAQVDCDKSKFFSISQDLRLAGVVEEAAVLAIERSLVPHPGVWTPEEAWHFALAKVCSSITSGWFRAFAYEHIFEVIKLYPKGYWDKFQKDVDEGKVKPYTGSKY